DDRDAGDHGGPRRERHASAEERHSLAGRRMVQEPRNDAVHQDRGRHHRRPDRDARVEVTQVRANEMSQHGHYRAVDTAISRSWMPSIRRVRRTDPPGDSLMTTSSAPAKRGMLVARARSAVTRSMR